VTVEPTRAATGCVRRWVRTALLAEVGAENTMDETPDLRALEPGDLLAAVVRQRVVEVIHAQAAELDLPAGLIEGIAHVRAARRELVPLQLLELARIRDLFEGAGVRYLSIKGPALAVQSTGDVGARGFGDLDVLVDPASVDSLVDLLSAHGWRSSVPLPDQASWAWRRILYTANELTFYGASCSVDLHWRLDPTIDGLPAFDVLWERRQAVEVGGASVPTLAPGDALAHLCLNAARDDWRWVRSLVDIHRVARLDGAWKHQRMRGLAVAALIVTDALVGLPLDTPGWVRDRMARVPPRVRDRVVQAAIRGEEGDERASEGPASRFWPLVRYQLAASTTPRDLRHTLGTLLLPGWAVRDVDAVSAWRGVPAGIGRRTSDFTRRSLNHLSDRRDG
jgi:hypothetical protein